MASDKGRHERQRSSSAATPRGDASEPDAGTPISAVIGSLLRAVVASRSEMDHASVEVAESYRTDPILRALAPPAFVVSEVRIRLRFAISGFSMAAAGGDDLEPQTRILVALPALAGAPEHAVSEVELRLDPQTLSTDAPVGPEIDPRRQDAGR
jgi:hypothetical protein